MKKAMHKSQPGATKLPPLAPIAHPAQKRNSIEFPHKNAIKQSPPPFDVIGNNQAKSKVPAKLKGLQKNSNVTAQKLPQKQKALPSIKSSEKQFDDLLEGCMTDIPPMPSTDVRLFISSTFTDMKQERNWLAKQAYPKLKELCAELGLDFRVIDMRWGILDTMTNDHQTEKLCLQEIANCQRISLGPNFISILGDRYGYRPLPTEIKEGEFEILCQEAKTEDGNWPIKLQEWYIKDENLVPAEYILQPITTKFKYFGDYANEEKRKQDTDGWWTEFNLLQKILRQSASSACEKGLFTLQQQHEYFKSVTECEIEDGISKVSDVTKHALGYLRRFQGLVDERVEDVDAKVYTEIITQGGKKKIDTEVAKFRQALFTDKIKAVLGENTRKYYVNWQSGGIDPDTHEEHQQYVLSFCKNFVEDTMRLITAAHHIKAQIIRRSEYYSDYEEILHHLHFCQKKCITFCGQDDILQQAKTFLQKKHRLPLVIHAESGVGKTSVMAMIMNKITDWFGPDSIRLVRFLGTSPKSFNIFDVLLSICGQLADICDKIMEPEGYKNMKNLLAYFPRFLRNVSRDLVDHEVFILLDSLDQLSSAHQAYLMGWVEINLPPNIHFIFSTLPAQHGCLDNLRKVLPNSECYLQLKPVPLTTGQQILEKHISHHQRTVSNQQKEFLNSILSSEATPLLLKIVADQAAKWKSYTPAEDLILAPTVKQAITHMFQDIEIKFGKLLVEHSLGYLTCGLNGLSEIELEDVLSCNNEVLADVYQYHNPPEENSIRIPALLWARIHNDLKEYITERQSQGKTTYFWYHRQFIEVATERYVTSRKQQIHTDLAELYMVESPFKKTISLPKRNITMKNADRQVTIQAATSKNRRRLECLVHHLKHSGDMAKFKSKTVCNIKYLVMKAQAFSYQYLVNELEDLKDTFTEDQEISLLYDVLSSASVKAVSQIPMQILARLDHDDQSHSHLQSLAKQAMKYGKTSQTPLLLPLFNCFGRKKDGDLNATSCDINENGQFVVTNSGESFIIWGLTQWTKHFVAKSADMKVNEVKLAVDDTVLLGWEKATGVLKAWNFTTGQLLDKDFGTGVIAFQLDRPKQMCYIARKEETMQVETWDIKKMEVKKTIPLKKFNFAEFRLLLTENEEFLVFLIYCDEAAQEEIIAFGKKALGGYKPHKGTLRFAAINLKKDSGEVRHCYRPLSKVPFLGNSIVAVSGNMVVIGLQITATYWNLETGKCDGLLVNGNRGMGQLYRPHWTLPKESAFGCTTGLERSANYKHAITGSEDGWALVYELQTGVVVGWKHPKANFKHDAPVTSVGISDDGTWAASASADGVLKLWKVTAEIGFDEAFNINMDIIVDRLQFSSNGEYLVVIGHATEGDEQKSQFCVFCVTQGAKTD